MIDKRKQAFDKISKLLAITRYDIEQHQAINDLSLNIHGENFFRDVFNFVFDASFENANFMEHNAAYIDLVDHLSKKVVQITTNRSKEKIKHSLNCFETLNYKGYQLEIFFLLEKSTPHSNTVKEIESEYQIDVRTTLKDSSDLLRAVENLETNKLIELCKRYFEEIEPKYTPEVALNIACRKLIKEVKAHNMYFDEPFGSIEVRNKIDINQLGQRIAHQLLSALDFTPILDDMDDSETPTELRELVVEKLFKEVLISQLKAFKTKSSLIPKTVNELQLFAVEQDISFDILINKLYLSVQQLIELDDFNGVHIPWVIVAYYFERCLVGRDKL